MLEHAPLACTHMCIQLTRACAARLALPRDHQARRRRGAHQPHPPRRRPLAHAPAAGAARPHRGGHRRRADGGDARLRAGRRAASRDDQPAGHPLHGGRPPLARLPHPHLPITPWPHPSYHPFQVADPFWLVCLILTCMPTANNIVVMCDLAGENRRAMSASIFYQVCVWHARACTSCMYTRVHPADPCMRHVGLHLLPVLRGAPRAPRRPHALHRLHLPHAPSRRHRVTPGGSRCRLAVCDGTERRPRTMRRWGAQRRAAALESRAAAVRLSEAYARARHGGFHPPVCRGGPWKHFLSLARRDARGPRAARGAGPA